MFSDLFVAPKKTPAKPAKPTKSVKKPKAKAVVPSAAEQTADFGPFEHVVEESPEATLVENTLEYEDIDIDEEWADDAGSDAGSEINYEATSVDMSVEDTDEFVGSMTSSPGFFTQKTSVEVEKARPPGVSLTFDDDSWID
jgi:hypothetical protein